MVKVQGVEVGETGLGLMGMTWRDHATPDEQAFAALRKAVEVGAVFWNGGEFYGDITNGPNSLTLLNRYFTKYPEDASKVFLSIKGGVLPPFTQDGSREGINKSVNNCLRLLPPSVKKIDLFECSRVVKEVPIEEQIATLADLVKEGKIGSIGLSEANAATIRRAAAVHPIAAVEVEVSLWETTYLTNGVTETCAELGIPVVAYSPLGRGFLTGQIKSRADIPAGDFRLAIPRFSEENFPKNLELVDKIKAVADAKGCTPASLATAWVRGLSRRKGFPQILPIPGATRADRVQENAHVETLTDADYAEIDKIMKSMAVAGQRYPDFAMHALEG